MAQGWLELEACEQGVDVVADGAASGQPAEADIVVDEGDFLNVVEGPKGQAEDGVCDRGGLGVQSIDQLPRGNLQAEEEGHASGKKTTLSLKSVLAFV